MKFQEIFRFEFAYQVRRAWPWLFVVVLLVLDFLMTRDGSVAEVLYSEFFLNSPFAIAKTTVFGGLIWLVMAAAIAGDAAARDVATGMHPLTYTAPVSKAAYLGGRFLAALVLNALILLAVQAGIVLGVYLPGVDAELIGPFRPAAFLTSYAFIALPNAFAATAIQFALAARSGRAMASYFGSFLIVFMGFFVASVLLFKQGLGTLLDPIGIRFVVEDMAHLWTPAEKNWRLMALEGTVLTNRLLWLAVGLVAIAVTYLSFRFAHRTGSSSLKRLTQRFTLRTTAREAHASLSASVAVTETTPVFLKHIPQASGVVLHARQALAIAWVSFRTIAASWAGLAMLAFIPLLTIPVVLDQMVSNDVPLVPITPRVIGELTASLSDELSRWVIIPFLIVFFAGELVWREREAGLGEITDAMPGSEWAPFLGKFLGLGLVLTLFMTLLMTAGILAQVILDYHPDSYWNEVGLYVKVLFGLQLTEYLLFALLALVIHVVVDQKYIGHLVAIIVFVFIAIASLFRIEHNMLIYGAGPAWSYTEMRGFGASLVPWLWFKVYWTAWALLLAVAARLFWVRGRVLRFRERLRIARSRFSRSTAWAAATAIVLIITVGGFIFYNTNIRNDYITSSEMKDRAAAYEQRYKRYADIMQPNVVAATLNVEIFPERRSVDIHGTYHLLNRSSVAIDSIHVATMPGVETGEATFDRPAARVLADEALYHRIYALEKPLRPGDSLQLAFRVRVEPQGFRENGVDLSVAANGTYFTNAWLPGIGYQKSRELITPADRRAYGLSPRPLIASLYDVGARTKYGEGVAFEAVIGTNQNQVAVAPGALRRTWTERGRRYFHYVTDAPVGGTWDFFSADYAVHEARWHNPDSAAQTVAIRIFHDPRHRAHLDRMVRSIRASLDYYSREFGPYRYSHLSVVERPGNGTGMHAEPGMLTYSEGFTSWDPGDDPGSHDHPYAIVAHEMGHQWTVPYAAVEGAPVMSESIAWYYGMKVVEHSGPGQLRQLLRYMRQPHPYPAIRRGEPLLRGLDPYLSYRRGPFALYALSEYIGENRVNKALRLLLEKHRQQKAPLATTLDLYCELKAVTPDSLQYMLHDLFEVNTYWELETEQATAKQIKPGTWQLMLDVQARKVVADSAGVETEIPMNDWIEIGVFAPAKGSEPKKPLYLQKHRIRSGRQTVILNVPQQPERAGIDPNHLLIDLDLEDNIRELKMEGATENEPD